METILEFENHVKFVKQDIASVPEATLNIKNICDTTVIFKIKTTNPDKYVVKPNHAVITPNKTTVIKITTQKASMQKIKNDRFLVVAGRVKNDVQVPEKPGETEAYLKDFFSTLGKDEQFTKKLKIQNDETLGLLFANYKANKEALHSSGAGRVVVGDDVKRSSVRSTMKTAYDEDAVEREIVELEKKRGKLLIYFQNYNSALSIDSLTHTIKLKKNNRELSMKVKKSVTLPPVKEEKSSSGFELIHIAGAFLIAFMIGLWYGSSS